MAGLRNKIYVGSLEAPLFCFENDAVYSVPSMQAVALVGQELSVDSFTPTVADSASTGDRTAPSDIINIPYGTPVWYYNNDNLVGRFYIDHVTRNGANEYELSCVSVIGLLEKMYHGGGLYASTTFGAVLEDILAGEDGLPVIEYDIDPDVASISVTGWLPYDTKRNNLYQLIFANGVNIIKNPDGAPRFTFIHTAPEDSQEIPEADIFYGGSVDYQTRYSRINVIEHTYAYIPGDDPESLYDNTEGEAVTREQIWFSNAPIYVPSITATEGLTVLSATENGAVISGTGKLTGIPYVHSTKTVSMDADNYHGDAKIVNVESCTLVNLLNSNNLCQRLYNFYCSRPNGLIKVIKNSIIFRDQRCGKPYRFLNPFGEQENAFLAELDINASSFNKADCVFYADYDPAGQMGLYNHCQILTGEGTWTVPEGVTQIYVVLIGGGQGGQSGNPGKNGNDATVYTNVSPEKDLSKIWYGAEGGDGGEGGNGGHAGRVYKVTISGEDLQASYAYSCGQGGAGGAATGFLPDTEGELRSALEAENPDTEYTDTQIANLISQQQSLSGTWQPIDGQEGTNTVFGEYSTAQEGSYVPQNAGIYEPISAQYFAQPGRKGQPGGKGGSRKVSNQDGGYWTPDGETVTFDGESYTGGRVGENRTHAAGLQEANFIAYGGNGAGAAVGLSAEDYPRMDGGDAPDATWKVVTE